jgi:hypothetical protein
MILSEWLEVEILFLFNLMLKISLPIVQITRRLSQLRSNYVTVNSSGKINKIGNNLVLFLHMVNGVNPSSFKFEYYFFKYR